MQSKHWILWNIFLACIPVVAGYLLALGFGVLTLQRKRVPWWVWIPLALVWLAFLPNTCYLLTEWRHYLFDPAFTEMRVAAQNNHVLMLPVAKWGLRFLVYSGIGVLCFALSIRPIDKLLQQRRINRIPWAIPFFFLISLGVYLGLNIRLNSWEIATAPGRVWEAATWALHDTLHLKTIVIFAGLLWLLYLIVDIWFDGLQIRLTRWGLLPGKGSGMSKGSGARKQP